MLHLHLVDSQYEVQSLKLQNQNKPIRAKAKTLKVAKSKI